MRIALTFGDAGENHAGMQMVGNLGNIGSGFTVKNLLTIKENIILEGEGENIQKNIKCEFINLNHNDSKDKAGVLVIRNFLNKEDADYIFEELNNVEWDTKYYDTRRKKVLNKRARSNIVILDDIEQEPDYINKKGRIVNGNKTIHFKKMKKELTNVLKRCICQGESKENDNNDKSKLDNLICEGNKYYDLKKCGIGYHGDAERRKVICVSLGANNYPMQWVWFKNSKPQSEPFKVLLNHGDVYIMSEKAVGYDWKKRSKLTLRHAAGANKYLSLTRFNKKNNY